MRARMHWLLPVLCLIACSDADEAPAAATGSVPSMQEARSQAAQSITEENADAEFEALKRELEGDR